MTEVDTERKRLVSDFTDFLMDKINTEIAPDFVIRVESNKMGYFDIEAGEIYLITVDLAKVVVA